MPQETRKKSSERDPGVAQNSGETQWTGMGGSLDDAFLDAEPHPDLTYPNGTAGDHDAPFDEGEPSGYEDRLLDTMDIELDPEGSPFPPEDHSATLESGSSEETSAPRLESEDKEDQAAALSRWKLPSRKTALIALSCLLCLILAGVPVYHKHRQNASSSKAVTLIRHPISVPRFEEKLDFIFLSTARSGKDIVSLSLEFEFRSEERAQRFRDEQISVRDTVYSFLLGCNPEKNSQKEWQRAVRRELQSLLNTKSPQARADRIRVSRLEKL